MALRHVLSGACAALLLVGTLSGCTPEPIVGVPTTLQSPSALSLVVGIPRVPDGVNPQEGALLAHVYAAALNAAGVGAQVKEATTAPGALSAALQQGAVDIVPVYSRDALSELPPSAREGGSDGVLDALSARLPSGVKVLDAAAAEVSAALVVTAVTAQKYQLKGLDDLGKICDQLTIGGSRAFQTGGHGLPGLGSAYKCVPKEYLALTATEEAKASSVVWSLLSDKIQVGEIHLSSPAIEGNSLVVLTDPKQLFLTQNIAPLVVEKRVPSEVQDVLNKVSAALTAEELKNLNSLSQDTQLGGLANAATAWLVQQGLIKAKS